MAASKAALLIIIVALALGLGIPARGQPAAEQRRCPGLTDNILCMPLPGGWHGSVGFGFAAGPAAWMLAGNFRFPRDAAKREGWPSVPPQRVLIGIGDFPIRGRRAHWPHARRLRLPADLTAGHLVAWHVRFAGRALFLSVRFGSRPDDYTRRLVDARLASVRRSDSSR
jgi:hypothetical protein